MYVAHPSRQSSCEKFVSYACCEETSTDTLWQLCPASILSQLLVIVKSRPGRTGESCDNTVAWVGHSHVVQFLPAFLWLWLLLPALACRLLYNIFLSVVFCLCSWSWSAYPYITAQSCLWTLLKNIIVVLTSLKVSDTAFNHFIQFSFKKFISCRNCLDFCLVMSVESLVVFWP